jgi:C1A family cysteine protease
MYSKNSRYGWKPDLPDKRDLKFAAPLARQLPAKIDMTAQCPAVYDQGALNSCTANAIGAAYEFELLKQKANGFMPSRLFIYYNERMIEGNIPTDGGAYIRDGIKSVARQGVCPEPEWQYIASEFAIKPFKQCYDDALKNKAISYQRIEQQLNLLKSCLADGYPVIIGFTVYTAFESPEVAKTGVLNMPAANEEVIGGHAVLVVGYDDETSRFILRNSWGPNWGKKGYFTMPYAYLTDPDLSADFWTIRLVTNTPGAQKPDNTAATKP